MKPQQTPVDRVTLILQGVKKLETAKELAYELDQLLPSNVKDDSPLIETYKEFGFEPEPKGSIKEGRFTSLDQAKNILFNQQKSYLIKELLSILSGKS